MKSAHCSVRVELKKVLQHQQEHGNQVSAEQWPAGGGKYDSSGILIISLVLGNKSQINLLSFGVTESRILHQRGYNFWRTIVFLLSAKVKWDGALQNFRTVSTCGKPIYLLIANPHTPNKNFTSGEEWKSYADVKIWWLGSRNLLFLYLFLNKLMYNASFENAFTNTGGK